MLRKIKKYSSLFLAVVMVLLTCAPTFVSANDSIVTSELVQTSDNALYSVQGQKLPEKLSTELAAYDVAISDNSLVEIVPLNDTSDVTALVVTNKNGTAVTKEILMSVNEDAEVQPIIVPGDDNISVMASGGGSTEVDPFFDDSLILKFWVQYNEFSGGYIQPVNTMFLYYDEEDQYNVTYGYANYFCCGLEFTYPDLVQVTPVGDYYQYDLVVEANNPRARTYYTANNPYRTDRVIDPSLGPFFSSQALDFEFYVDGRRISDTLTMNLFT